MKMKMMIIFCPFSSNGTPVEWNWQRKTEVVGEKPVSVPLCPPQIPHGLNRDRNRASAVGGRRLTAWAMVRPQCHLNTLVKGDLFLRSHLLWFDSVQSGRQVENWRTKVVSLLDFFDTPVAIYGARKYHTPEDSNCIIHRRQYLRTHTVIV
jgi:hypothetical protein